MMEEFVGVLEVDRVEVDEAGNEFAVTPGARRRLDVSLHGCPRTHIGAWRVAPWSRLMFHLGCFIQPTAGALPRERIADTDDTPFDWLQSTPQDDTSIYICHADVAAALGSPCAVALWSHVLPWPERGDLYGCRY